MSIDAELVAAIHKFVAPHRDTRSVGELLALWTQELIKSECRYCRSGYAPLWKPYNRCYAHRAPEGKNSAMIYVPCRANLLLCFIRSFGVGADSTPAKGTTE